MRRRQRGNPHAERQCAHQLVELSEPQPRRSARRLYCMAAGHTCGARKCAAQRNLPDAEATLPAQHANQHHPPRPPRRLGHVLSRSSGKAVSCLTAVCSPGHQRLRLVPVPVGVCSLGSCMAVGPGQTKCRGAGCGRESGQRTGARCGRAERVAKAEQERAERAWFSGAAGSFLHGACRNERLGAGLVPGRRGCWPGGGRYRREEPTHWVGPF